MIAATLDGVRIVCLYAPNGQAIGSEKYEYKLRWYAALRDWLANELAHRPRLAVLGDLNVAPEDRDVHDPQAWQGQVLVSEAARAAFRALLGLGHQVHRQVPDVLECGTRRRIEATEVLVDR